MADINIKAKITTDTSDASKGVEQFENKIKGASNSAKGSQQDFGKLKDTIGSLGPAGEMATGKMEGLTQAFNVLKAHPIIAVFGIIAGLIIAIAKRMSEMEGVSDALGKAFGTLSGIMNAFVSKVLTPLIDGFVWLIENTTSGIVKVLDMLGVTSEETADRMGSLVETLDDLEESEKNSAIATAESNRKLQEAREIAADANLPIKDRVNALREAAKIEREESEKVIAINRAKAAALLEQFALENGAKQQTIQLLRQGTIESLKAARADLLTQKNVNKDKIFEIDQYIIAAENEQAALSKISKRTQSQINAIEREAQREREQAAKDAEERRKKRQEKEMADYLAMLQRQRDAMVIDPTKVPELQRTNIAQQAITSHNAWLDSMTADRMAKDLANNSVTMALDKQSTDMAIANAQARSQAQVDAARMTGEALGALSDLVGRQTVAGKSLATAQALINTYLGVTEVLRNKTVIPEPFGTIQKIASVATILASGFSAVRNIVKTNIPGAGGGGGGSTASMQSVAAPLTPATGTTTLDQQSIQSIGNAAASGVNRAYVLDSDVKNSQERSARLTRAARLA